MKLQPYRAVLLLTAVTRLLTAGTTHIHDTLPVNSDGTPATGAVVISWPTFVGTDGVLNTASQKAVAINNGILDTTLAANPAGVNYTASFDFAAQTAVAQNWHVPDSTSAVTLAMIIVPRPTAPAALTGAYKVDPTGISPGKGLPGQVMTLNTLLQWSPAPASVNSGPAGPQGPIGPTGPIGPIGHIGPQGSPGTSGATGPAGPIGPQGATGITGAQGPIGISGPQGPTGVNGAPGVAGTAGPAGPQGPIGPTGPAGANGAAGATGATGPAGPNNNLAGQTLASTPPTDGQVIAYNAANSQYQPSSSYFEDSRKQQSQFFQPANDATNNLAPGQKFSDFECHRGRKRQHDPAGPGRNRRRAGRPE